VGLEFSAHNDIVQKIKTRKWNGRVD